MCIRDSHQNGHVGKVGLQGFQKMMDAHEGIDLAHAGEQQDVARGVRRVDNALDKVRAADGGALSLIHI